MDTEEQKHFYLRHVNLMAAEPGRADAQATGEPISILTLSFRGEIEQPICLNVRDTKKLAISLFNILAHFDDPKAKKVMAYFEALKREEEAQMEDDEN